MVYALCGFCGDDYGSFGDTHIGYEVYFVVDSDDVGGGELLLEFVFEGVAVVGAMGYVIDDEYEVGLCDDGLCKVYSFHFDGVLGVA